MQSKSARLTLVGVFLLLIYGVPLSQAVLELSRRETPVAVEVFTRTPNAENLRAYEKDLETASWVQNAVRPYLQYWRYLSMGDLGDKGIIGRDGWLFYKPGIQFLVEPWPAAEVLPSQGDPLQAVTSFRDQLKSRGVDLLVLIAPGKESVYPERLAARAANAAEPVNGHVRRFAQQLRDAGIDTIDLSETLTAARQSTALPMYLVQDTHWSPLGAKTAAEAVARHVLDRGWAAKGNLVYDVKELPLQRHGDVLRMAKSAPLLTRVQPESIACEQVLQPGTDSVYKDDPASPILVLGDSFLRIYQLDEPKGAGFIAHLARALGQPVASIVNDGGASTLVRQELSRKSGLLQGKRLVVWEFVERDLRFGTEGWQEVTLAKQ